MSAEKKRYSSKTSNPQQKKLKTRHEYLILSDDEPEEDDIKRKQRKNCYPSNLVHSSQPILGTPLRKKLHSILATWKPPLKQTNVAENSHSTKTVDNRIKKSQSVDKNVRDINDRSKSKENEKPFDSSVTNSKVLSCDAEPPGELFMRHTSTPNVPDTQNDIQNEISQQNTCSGSVVDISEKIDSSELKNKTLRIQPMTTSGNKSCEVKMSPSYDSLKSSQKTFCSVKSERFKNEFQEKISLLRSCTDPIQNIRDEISSSPNLTEVRSSAVSNIKQTSLDNEIISVQSNSKASQESFPNKSNSLQNTEGSLKYADECEMLQYKLKEATKPNDKNELEHSDTEVFQGILTERKSSKNVLSENKSNYDVEEGRDNKKTNNYESSKNLIENYFVENYSDEFQMNNNQQCNQPTNEVDPTSKSVCKYESDGKNKINYQMKTGGPPICIDSPEKTKNKNCISINESSEQITPNKNINKFEKVLIENNMENLPSVNCNPSDVLDVSNQNPNENNCHEKEIECDSKNLKIKTFEKFNSEHFEEKISSSSQVQMKTNKILDDTSQPELSRCITDNAKNQNYLYIKPTNEYTVKKCTGMVDDTNNGQVLSISMTDNYSPKRTVNVNTTIKFPVNEQNDKFTEQKLTGNTHKIENKHLKQQSHNTLKNQLSPETVNTCIPSFNDIISLEQEAVDSKSKVESLEETSDPNSKKNYQQGSKKNSHIKLKNQMSPESFNTCIPSFNDILSLEQEAIDRESTIESLEETNDHNSEKKSQQVSKNKRVDYSKDISGEGNKSEAIPSTSNENCHARPMINAQICQPETELEDDFCLSDSQLDAIENQTFPGTSTFNPTIPSSTNFNTSYFPRTNAGAFTPTMPSMKWIAQLKEDKRRLQSVVREISQLNAMLTRATREIWPSRFKRT